MSCATLLLGGGLPQPTCSHPCSSDHASLGPAQERPLAHSVELLFLAISGLYDKNYGGPHFQSTLFEVVLPLSRRRPHTST